VRWATGKGSGPNLDRDLKKSYDERFYRSSWDKIIGAVASIEAAGRKTV
jgi:hypothetical protein